MIGSHWIWLGLVCLCICMQMSLSYKRKAWFSCISVIRSRRKHSLIYHLLIFFYHCPPLATHGSSAAHTHTSRRRWDLWDTLHTYEICRNGIILTIFGLQWVTTTLHALIVKGNCNRVKTIWSVSTPLLNNKRPPWLGLTLYCAGGTMPLKYDWAHSVLKARKPVSYFLEE